MGIKAINLDFYGTLVDWLPVWIEVSKKIVDENKLELSPKEFALSWRNNQRQMLDCREFTPYKENILDALNMLCIRHKIKNNDYHELLFGSWKNIKPFPEVNKVLNSLKQKYKLAVCTNSSGDLFDICAKSIPIKFDNVFISDEIKVNKPHKRMYEYAIKSLGAGITEIIHVASSQMDVKGAAYAGLAVCWINRARETRMNGIPKPNFEIYDLRELSKILQLAPQDYGAEQA